MDSTLQFVIVLNVNLMVKKDVQMGIQMIYYHLVFVVNEAYTTVMGLQPENPV
jgi:hypothetical protein